MLGGGSSTIRDLGRAAAADLRAELESRLRSENPSRPCLGKRVLFLINGFRIDGGAETAVAAMVSGLSDAGVEVHLADLMGEGPLPALTNLPAERVASFDLRGRYRDWWGIFALLRYMRKHRFDIVHTHLEPANTIGTFVARMAGVGIVLPTAHSMRLSRTRRRRWINRLIYSQATRIVTVSRLLGEHLAKHEACPPGKITHLPNSVDLMRLPAPEGVDLRELRAELGFPAGAPLIVHVGSMLPKKKQEDLLTAFAEVRQEHPDALLLMVGDGPRRAELEAIARRVAPPEAIRFLGVRRDAPRLLAAADLSVLSSIQEGLPLVVLESFAVGTPVVATEVAGLAELVEHGRTGILVPPERPERLAAAIGGLLEDPLRRACLAEAARDFVRRSHDLPVLVGRYLDLFDALIRERADP